MKIILTFLATPLCVLAQQAPAPSEFPADSTPPSAETLHKHVSGKVFRVKPADGSSWRLEYKSAGYAFVDTSRGYRDTGKWRVEGSQLCGDMQRGGNTCNETRLKDGLLYLKRNVSGEVIALVPD